MSARERAKECRCQGLLGEAHALDANLGHAGGDDKYKSRIDIHAQAMIIYNLCMYFLNKHVQSTMPRSCTSVWVACSQCTTLTAPTPAGHHVQFKPIQTCVKELRCRLDHTQAMQYSDPIHGLCEVCSCATLSP